MSSYLNDYYKHINQDLYVCCSFKCGNHPFAFKVVIEFIEEYIQGWLSVF